MRCHRATANHQSPPPPSLLFSSHPRLPPNRRPRPSPRFSCRLHRFLHESPVPACIFFAHRYAPSIPVSFTSAATPDDGRRCCCPTLSPALSAFPFFESILARRRACTAYDLSTLRSLLANLLFKPACSAPALLSSASKHTAAADSSSTWAMSPADLMTRALRSTSGTRIDVCFAISGDPSSPTPCTLQPLQLAQLTCQSSNHFFPHRYKSSKAQLRPGHAQRLPCYQAVRQPDSW